MNDGGVRDLEEWFRLRYGLRRQALRLGLSEGVDPVMIRLGDDLVLLHDGRREVRRILPREYHEAKTLCHLPLTTYAWLTDLGSQHLSHHDERRLRRLLEDLDTLELVPASPGGHLVAAVHSVVEATLERHTVDLDRLADLADAVEAPTRALVEAATRIELTHLDASVRELTADWSPVHWSHLLVAICGNHQARARESTKTYFQRLLGEAHAEGARGECQLVYCENARTEDEALDLLAAHVLGREIGSHFLGSAQALQQDVQGEAAARVLDEIFAVDEPDEPDEPGRDRDEGARRSA